MHMAETLLSLATRSLGLCVCRVFRVGSDEASAEVSLQIIDYDLHMPSSRSSSYPQNGKPSVGPISR